MQTKQKLIVGLFCLIMISCSSQQDMDEATQVKTFETDIMPNNFSVTGNGRVYFTNWSMSFSLPKDWDVNRHEFGMDSGFKIESYYFYGHEYPLGDGRKDYPMLAFLFRPIEDDVEMGTYLQNIKNWTDDAAFKFLQTYSPMDIGLNLDTAIIQKCQYQKSEMVNITCYVMRAVYDNKGVEIQLLSNTNLFDQVDRQFLEIMKSISFEQ